MICKGHRTGRCLQEVSNIPRKAKATILLPHEEDVEVTKNYCKRGMCHHHNFVKESNQEETSLTTELQIHGTKSGKSEGKADKSGFGRDSTLRCP
jgi:hypothetical protein